MVGVAGAGAGLVAATVSDFAVAVVGAGSWGTALAVALARGGHDTRLVVRTPEAAGALRRARENTPYLPEIAFPEGLEPTADMAEAVRDARAVLVAVPSMVAADALARLAAMTDAPVIGAFKGIHPHTLERTDALMTRMVGAERALLLSGPSFALEVARGMPTAMTLAAADLARAEALAPMFADSNFRIYVSDDMIGVAMGGALKNVVAIAAGMADGLELGHNAVAAVITRGLAEMARLAMACGGRRETLMGLSGLGDLVLTCTGDLSRNRRFGVALARGMSVDAALAHVGQVVEGVETAAAARSLARDAGVDAPLMEAVHRVLGGELALETAVRQLMTRPSRSEF